MNVGLIYGRVLNPDSSRADGDCTVYLRKVSVDGKPTPFVGRRGSGVASTTLDSDGEFLIPFAWDPPSVAGPPVSRRVFKYAEFDLRAVAETRVEQGRTTTERPVASVDKRIHAYWLGRVSDSGLTTDDLSDALWPTRFFADDLVNAYRYFLVIPIPSLKWTTFDRNVMVGGGVLRLRPV